MKFASSTVLMVDNVSSEKLVNSAQVLQIAHLAQRLRRDLPARHSIHRACICRSSAFRFR
jgi:hypothetical protein